MLTYVMLGLMVISIAIIAFRTKRHGPEFRLVENAAMAVIVSVAASFYMETSTWFRWVSYIYIALGAAYIAYGAYGKYKGGTDGYGQ